MRVAKQFQCFIKHHAMRAHGEMEVYLLTFLTSAFEVSEWSA
jgi:hypothetical protein